MKVIRAKNAGFCMGVSLALRKLDDLLEKSKTKFNHIKTFGPIIHNPQVLQDYADKGVVIVHNVEEVKSGDAVLIRAHGIPLAIETELLKKGITLVDATCPKVKKAQLSILEATQKGGVLLLFGEASHPEVLGLLSYASPEAKVFSTQDDLKSFLNSSLFDINVSYFLAAQTTQDKEEFVVMENILKTHLNHNIPVLQTICDATRTRQSETLEIAEKVELMLVLGGKNSANTRRLVNVSESVGTEAYHIETADELFSQEKLLAKLKKTAIIGLTAGASTPINLVDELQKRIEQSV
ncbi:4-hydroxy-3-methylbut-2-enyl diphosphate reductase [Desulfovibrio litoralis]|uniref:4-hydroxy-3-methylbut-2-enyl diphosphate reductase n=1 Tax=Desulfovibrio litoralis DSM 11393 TaxID=1121455 RepID=A0A1M7T9Y7_9BACT|nr:4-hydroxy-3-methylbut-2-enyl diphosphate reductase [Desulfovibrio litoralis]SHN67545.1 4-hydroxy-3-methylbut-2-enyl diphosphate reductase [Desulfovibrio litoralis DSM 11393]